MQRRNLVLALGAAAVAAGAGIVRHYARGIEARPGIPLQSIDLGTVTTHRLAMSDGAVVHVKEYGDPNGRPIVLLHGVLLQWWMWNAVGAELLADHRVVAWDMRGHGESTLGSQGMTLEEAAADLRVMMDELALERAVLAGYSMGGMVLGRVLVDDSSLLQRSAGLAFLSTSAAPAMFGPIDTGPVARSRVLAGVVGATDRSWLLDLATRPTALTRAVIGAAGFGRAPTAAMIEDLRRLTSEMDPGVTSAALESMAHHDVRDLLGEIDRPSVVVVGERDLLSPPAHSRVLADRIPEAELIVLEGAGHGITMERPDEVASAIRQLAQRAGD